MLPLPDLDNKTYQQLFDEAVKLINKYYAGWTDRNIHDPGITIIEMLAWLIEMQQYYLNEITDESYFKYLKLLGFLPSGYIPSRMDISFSRVKESITICAGTQVYSDGDIPFEVEKETVILKDSDIKILVSSDGQTYYDCTSFNNTEGLSFYAFEEEIKKGNEVYIGFDDKLPKRIPIKIFVDLYDEYPCKKIPYEDGNQRPCFISDIKYTFYGSKGKSDKRIPGWLELDILEDKTYNLNESGYITFKIHGKMQPYKIPPADEKDRYWIRLTLQEANYELSPRIVKIKMNTVSAVQKETICSQRTFSGNGKPNQTLTLSDYLTCFGEVLVQVKQTDGTWVDWEKVSNLNNSGKRKYYVVKKNNKNSRVKISFGDGVNGCVLPEGQENVRVISFLSDLKDKLLVGKSTGQIKQTFKLPYFPILSGSLIIQVGKKENEDSEMVWEDWVYTESLERSGRNDRHFSLNEESWEIKFGDNINGRALEVSDTENIRIISYEITFGEKGNIGRGRNMEIPDDKYVNLHITNDHEAKGGKDPETLRDLIIRFKKDMKKVYRAVTAADYEAIAQLTPGVRIARVKAIPGYNPDLPDTESCKDDSQVTVVIIPYGENSTPMPGRSTLQKVKMHLEKYRQLTTEVFVTGPQYVKVTVYAEVVGLEGKKVSSNTIMDEIMKYIAPFDGRDLMNGWIIGRGVYKSDIYRIIKAVEGVNYIKNLRLSAEGRGIKTNEAGDIILPHTGIVYSGDHEIEIVG